MLPSSESAVNYSPGHGSQQRDHRREDQAERVLVTNFPIHKTKKPAISPAL